MYIDVERIDTEIGIYNPIKVNPCITSNTGPGNPRKYTPEFVLYTNRAGGTTGVVKIKRPSNFIFIQ
jgi:hypothetical protein